MLYRYLPRVKWPTACLRVTTLLPSYRGRMFSSLGFGSGLVIVNATWEYLCFRTYFNIIISDNQVLQFWECTFRQGYSLRVWESDSSWSYQSEMTWRTVCGTQRWPSGYHQKPCTEPYMKSRHQLTSTEAVYLNKSQNVILRYQGSKNYKDKQCRGGGGCAGMQTHFNICFYTCRG